MRTSLSQNSIFAHSMLKMRFFTGAILFLLFISLGCAQHSIDKTLERFNKKTVPYIHVEEVTHAPNIVLLDAREREEFEVSHLQNALWVGHKKFTPKTVLSQITDKNTHIVVYCSIGVRSENVAEKLIKSGYTHVKNLYGGIFEWKNQGYPVFNTKGEETQKVHAYSKYWGKLLTNAEKIY